MTKPTMMNRARHEAAVSKAVISDTMRTTVMDRVTHLENIINSIAAECEKLLDINEKQLAMVEDMKGEVAAAVAERDAARTSADDLFAKHQALETAKNAQEDAHTSKLDDLKRQLKSSQNLNDSMKLAAKDKTALIESLQARENDLEAELSAERAKSAAAEQALADLKAWSTTLEGEEKLAQEKAAAAEKELAAIRADLENAPSKT